MLDTGFRVAAALLPAGVPIVIGLVLAFGRRTRSPRIARPAMLGLALHLLVVLISAALILVLPALSTAGWSRESVLKAGSVAGLFLIALTVAAWCTLLVALLRAMPARDDRTPTGRHALLDAMGSQVVADEGTTLLPTGAVVGAAALGAGVGVGAGVAAADDGPGPFAPAPDRDVPPGATVAPSAPSGPSGPSGPPTFPVPGSDGPPPPAQEEAGDPYGLDIDDEEPDPRGPDEADDRFGSTTAPDGWDEDAPDADDPDVAESDDIDIDNDVDDAAGQRDDRGDEAETREVRHPDVATTGSTTPSVAARGPARAGGTAAAAVADPVPAEEVDEPGEDDDHDDPAVGHSTGSREAADDEPASDGDSSPEDDAADDEVDDAASDEVDDAAGDDAHPWFTPTGASTARGPDPAAIADSTPTTAIPVGSPSAAPASPPGRAGPPGRGAPAGAAGPPGRGAPASAAGPPGRGAPAGAAGPPGRDVDADDADPQDRDGAEGSGNLPDRPVRPRPTRDWPSLPS